MSKTWRLAVLALAVVLVGAATAHAQPGKIEVLWLGQSATRVTTLTGQVIVIDPFLTQNPRTPPQWKNLDALGRVDLVLVTHAHADHLGDGPALAKKHHAPLWGPTGLGKSLVTLGVLPPELAPGMNKGGTIAPLGPDIRITMVHADHSSELTWRNPATGTDETHFGGEPVGFVIRFENGFTLYHMGDTALFGDMRWIGERYKPDLIMIPIDGHFTMGPEDAAIATRDLIKPKFAIPIHYGTFPQQTGTPQQYIQALGGAPVKVFAINPGDALTF